MSELTRQQIAMRSKIRKLFPKKRIGVYLPYRPRTVATVNLFGTVSRSEGEQILKKSGMFSEIHYQYLLDNYMVFWK